MDRIRLQIYSFGTVKCYKKNPLIYYMGWILGSGPMSPIFHQLDGPPLSSCDPVTQRLECDSEKLIDININRLIKRSGAEFFTHIFNPSDSHSLLNFSEYFILILGMSVDVHTRQHGH